MCLAVPGIIRDIHGDDPLLRTGDVDFGGLSRSVALACVPEAKVGDWVLVHAGIAIGQLRDDNADRLHGLLASAFAATDSDHGP